MGRIWKYEIKRMSNPAWGTCLYGRYKYYLTRRRRDAAAQELFEQGWFVDTRDPGEDWKPWPGTPIASGSSEGKEDAVVDIPEPPLPPIGARSRRSLLAGD